MIGTETKRQVKKTKGISRPFPLSIGPAFDNDGSIRLSREDLQKINRGLADSSNVKNQRDILNDFHFNHTEEFESCIEHFDDGNTGTNTERESSSGFRGM